MILGVMPSPTTLFRLSTRFAIRRQNTVRRAPAFTPLSFLAEEMYYHLRDGQHSAQDYNNDAFASYHSEATMAFRPLFPLSNNRDISLCQYVSFRAGQGRGALHRYLDLGFQEVISTTFKNVSRRAIVPPNCCIVLALRAVYPYMPTAT